jgi:hypothetical protein
VGNREEQRREAEEREKKCNCSDHLDSTTNTAATENDYTENRVSKKDRKGKNGQQKKQRLGPLHGKEEENCSNRHLSSPCL